MSSQRPENPAEIPEPDNYTPYSQPAPLHIGPSPIRQTRELIESGQVRGVAHAVSRLFMQAAITVDIDGDETAWGHPGQGALFVGDHHHGLESVAAVAAFGDDTRQREDIHFVGKPFALQARVAGALGAKGAAMLLPVIPSSLARENRPRPDRNLFWRAALYAQLPSRAAVQTINTSTLRRCADLAAAGHIIVVYPTGGVMDATKRPWRTGIGRIIAQLPETAHDRVTVVPFQARRFPGLRIVRSLLLAHYGRQPKPLAATITLGKQQTVAEILTESAGQSAQAITDYIHKQYCDYFAR